MIPKVNFLSILLKNEAKTSKKSENPHILHGGSTESFGKSIMTEVRTIIQAPMDAKSKKLYLFVGNKKKSKHIKVRVVQSTDPFITKQISDQPHRWFRHGGLLDSDKSNKLSFMDRGLEQYEGSLFRNPYDETLGGVEIKYDKNNKKVYCFPHRFTFKVPEQVNGEKVEHLTYFVYAYLDVKSLSMDEDFDISELMQNDSFANGMIGKVNKQVVIHSGKTKKTNQVFYTTKSMKSSPSIWTGGIHYHGTRNPGPNGYIGYMGDHEGTMGPELYLGTLPNNIVQDFRKYDDMKKINFDFSTPIENGSERSVFGSKNKSVFGEMYTSIDGSRNSKFSFSFDIRNAIVQNTTFTSLAKDIFDNGNLKDIDEILNKKIIKDFKVFRNRVYEHSYAQRSKDLNKSIKNDQAKLIAQSSDTKFGALRQYIGPSSQKNISQDSGGGTIREINVNLELSNFSDSKGVRFYTGTDIQIPKNGKYCYSVEITMEDPMLNWIKNRVRSLEDILYIKNSSNSYEEYLLETKKNKSFFNNFTNRFTQHGIKNIRQKFGKGFSHIKIIEFFNVLDRFCFFKNNNTRSEMFMFLDSISSVEFGNPMGVEISFKIMEEIYQKILKSSLLLSKHVKYADSLHAESKYSAGSNPIRQYTLRHKFQTKVDGRESSSSGYDYLTYSDLGDEIPQFSNGLMGISATQYEKRINLETEKLFHGSNTEIIQQNLQIRSDGQVLNPLDSVDFTKYGYLSPSMVNIAGTNSQNLLNNGRMNSDMGEINNLMLNIIRQNLQDFQTLDTKNTNQNARESNKDAIKKKNENINIKYDITSLASMNQISIKTKQGEEISNSNIDATNLFLTLFQQKYFNYLTDSIWSCDYYTNLKNINKEFLNWSKAATNNNSYKSSNPPLKRAPNHVKALMIDLDYKKRHINRAFDSLENQLRETKPLAYKYDVEQSVTSPRNPSDFFEQEGQIVAKNKILYQTPEFLAFFVFNYKNIVKIEYLVGYDKGNINSPVWRELTSRSWSFFSKQNGNVMCRMVPYQNELYGVREYSFLNLPTYNKYFVINFGNTRSETPKAPTPRANQQQFTFPPFNSQRAENMNEPIIDYDFSNPIILPSDRVRLNAGMNRAVGSTRSTNRTTSTTGAGTSSTY